ncbi:MAG: carboxylesterase/lipase family protein [Proteobacteria bacterium]|nr:carboxylesterase/lipase family protein [Pseudomonadota bacterium]
MGTGLAFAKEGAPVARTRHGEVRGYLDDGIKVFKGVPYGADTATRRFLPPAPPEPWQGVREATAYGLASPQTHAGEAIGEDCLKLNVWTPGLRDGARRPVMFYIHGGEYSHGSGSAELYDGARLCRRGDVVVVTVNHRLAAVGHLYLGKIAGPEYAASGNVGILDLILALRWVRDNIAEFGGDPSRVMVFGQSGGGAKIATMTGIPLAKGLFHRAITMSGQQVTASGPLGATERAKAYLAALKLAPEQWPQLKTLPIERLVEAMDAPDPNIHKSGIYWGPVLDNAVIHRHAFYPDAARIMPEVPLIIGNTHDETRYFFRNEPGLFSLTWDALPARLGPEMRTDIDPDFVVAEYRRLYPNYSPTDVFFAASTAARSWRGAVIEQEVRAASGLPVQAYQVNWRSLLDGGKWGAPHTIDIPLAFDNTDKPAAASGDGPAARAMAEVVSETFIAFARTGDPANPKLPAWPVYELDKRSTMIFDLPPHVEDDPRAAERRLFAQVPWVQRGTF